MNPLNTSSLLLKIVQSVEEKGVRITVSSDQAELMRIGTDLSTKKPSLLFHPDFVDLVPDRILWLKAVDEKDNIAAITVAKLDDTGRSTLGEFLRPHLKRGYEASAPNVRCKALEEMKGRCVYHGDSWVAREWRSAGIGPDTTKVILLACMIQWQPDFIYAFFEDHIQYSGVSSRFWYHHAERIGQHFKSWLKPTDFIGWMSYEDLVNLIELECPRNGLAQLQR